MLSQFPDHQTKDYAWSWNMNKNWFCLMPVHTCVTETVSVPESETEDVEVLL